MLAMMGLILGGDDAACWCTTPGDGRAVAGALYLFSGAIFPLEVLPAFLSPIGYANPIFYCLLRRSLSPTGWSCCADPHLPLEHWMW
jgi:ABC-2 type transport system permease protein